MLLFYHLPYHFSYFHSETVAHCQILAPRLQAPINPGMLCVSAFLALLLPVHCADVDALLTTPSIKTVGLPPATDRAFELYTSTGL